MWLWVWPRRLGLPIKSRDPAPCPTARRRAAAVRRLLRPSRQRPTRSRAAEEGGELTSSHLGLATFEDRQAIKGGAIGNTE